MILEGGTIHTGDPALPRVAALPIDDRGRVSRGVEAWEGDTSAVSTERIDLEGWLSDDSGARYRTLKDSVKASDAETAERFGLDFGARLLAR